MKKASRLRMISVALSTLFTTTLALAAPPANLGGTNWVMQNNVDVEQLVITNQGGAGGAGGPNCPLIIGQIGNANIRGWYCPLIGRIHFLHTNISTDATVRVFTGNVSDDVPGQPLYMGGTMSVLNAAFGSFGEYNFSAVH